MMKQSLLRFHKSKSVRWKLPNEDAECDYHLPPHDNPLKPHQSGLAGLFKQPALQPSASSSSSSSSSSSASVKHSLRKSRSVIERWFNGLPGSSNRDELTHSDSVFEKITKSKILGSEDNAQADVTPTTTTMVNDTDEEKCVAEEEKKVVVLDLQKDELEEEETINIPETSGSEGTESTGFSFTGNSLKDFKVKVIEKQVKFNTPSPSPDSKDKPGKGLLKKKSFQDLLSITTKKQQRC
ncbi:hypothetical protein Cantr_00704 [Candida viswanathii]|uniref:Uncharacterized protein n=1 Tax=Candida viswanathii TaxID=5486 RepID=A0A367YGE6_9ASCO|nr:hypothetical protein Cantr_00704 [Candida viswanathii]